MPRFKVPQHFAVSDNEPELFTTGQEDPIMATVRDALWIHAHQSQSHFELGLEVFQIEPATCADIDHAKFTLTSAKVVFRGAHVEGYISVPAKVQVRLSKPPSKPRPYITVRHLQRKYPLKRFLQAMFPISDAILDEDKHWRWWLSNRKTFNWTGLPTELKECIIEHCMHRPYDQLGAYDDKLTNFNRRYRPYSKAGKPVPFEIVQQLGDWYNLLYVSFQVREITLRLCMTGSTKTIHSSGLCISANSYKDFVESFMRLGNHYQLIKPHSFPKTGHDKQLARCYLDFPNTYPELSRFATLRHGIRKVCLSMDFMASMRFFDVQAYGFPRYPGQRARLTYDAFDRLPHLNEIVFILPRRPRKGWVDSPYGGGPTLFHHESPCPRALHRVIYERVAEVLAPHKKVTVLGFVDAEEQERFIGLRTEAVNALGWTEADLRELYADDGGGIELPEDTKRASMPAVAQQKTRGDVHHHMIGTQGRFFPPECFCEEPCFMKLC